VIAKRDHCFRFASVKQRAFHGCRLTAALAGYFQVCMISTSESSALSAWEETMRSLMFLVVAATVFVGCQRSESSPASPEGKVIRVLTDRTSSHLNNIFAYYEKETGVKVETNYTGDNQLARLAQRPKEADLIVTKNADLTHQQAVLTKRIVMAIQHAGYGLTCRWAQNTVLTGLDCMCKIVHTKTYVALQVGRGQKPCKQSQTRSQF